MKKISSKKIVAILTCCVILLMSIPIQSFAYYDPIRIFVNNQQVSSDVEPVIINSRTMVPLRVISESLHANVYWDNSTRSVTIKKGTDTIVMSIGNSWFQKNSSSEQLDSPPVIKNNRTLVPIRAIASAFNLHVAWVNDQRSVQIFDDMHPPFRIDKKEVYTTDNGWSERVFIVPENSGVFTPDSSIAIPSNLFLCSITQNDKKNFSITPLSPGTLDITFQMKIDNEIIREKMEMTIYPGYEKWSDIPDFSRMCNVSPYTSIEDGGQTLYVYDTAKISPTDYANFITAMKNLNYVVEDTSVSNDGKMRMTYYVRMGGTVVEGRIAFGMLDFNGKSYALFSGIGFRTSGRS